MTLKERLTEDMKTAMKAKDAVRLGVLRMLKSKLLEAEVEQRTAHGLDYQIDDESALRVMSAYAKQRRESAASFRQGGRDDLATKEEQELRIVEEYLPQQLAESEIRALVQQAIAESGAAGKQDVGKLMKALMPKVQGRADGKLVSRIAQEML